MPSPATAVAETPWRETRYPPQKPFGRRQHHACEAERGAGAARTADALHGKGRGLRLAGAFGKRFGAHLHVVEQFEIGKLAGELCGRHEARERVFRGDAGHGDGAFGKGRALAEVVGGDAGDPVAAEHAQGDVVCLRALAFLELSLAHLDAERDAGGGHHVGRVGACLEGGSDERAGLVHQPCLVNRVLHLVVLAGREAVR